ncbi:MAG TPA: malto-oligosyltrehalose trehalohydrolase [Bryobacteraceae bacterium]|nr:malto-oligosyltrehalose trehalohydrolase [Bryobacteraceae bacterium]
MHKFQVWAPRASDVAVQLGDQREPMQPSGRGWWSLESTRARPGTDYGFVLDGEGPFPDPRSHWQPSGINGLSRLVDHSVFRWTDQNWQAKPLSSAIIYELHVGTFTPEGTFRAIVEKLDYLLELGVTHIELMPVGQFSGPWGWGYDGVDLFAPHHEYGTPDDLKFLVDTCHRRGIAVLLDVVYNHFGPTGNYLGKYGPYLINAYKTPWGQAVNLDHRGSHEVRRFLADNALMWLRDYHFDGLRLDAVHAFVDNSAIHFLEFLSSEVKALAARVGRHLVLIAESDLNAPCIVRSREANGFGIDAQWSDDFHHALHSVLTGERKGYYEDFGSLAQLAKSLKCVFVYDGQYSPHRDAIHGRPAIGLSAWHFLGYSQNHDQVGNRAQGERLSHLVSLGRAKMAAAIVLTAPFVPMLFQGEEFAASAPFLYFSQHEDAELGQKVSEGRKNEFRAFGWEPDDVPDPQNRSSFERSKLDWEEVYKGDHADMFAWYKQLVALRRTYPELTDGRLDEVEIAFDERAQWLTTKRGDIELVCNLAPDRQAIPISRMPRGVIASNDKCNLRPGLIEIPGESVAILRPEAFASMQEHLSQYASA